MADRKAVITLSKPPSLLVLEVVSEPTKSTDYRTKYREYSVLEIPECWIVDPMEDKVAVRQLNEGRYDESVLIGAAVI